MSSKILVRASGWVVLWALLFWVSRANHPTALLNGVATTLMVFAAAAAFAIIIQTARRVSAVSRVCITALCIIGAGVIAALAIRTVYDVEVGPDPRRFGLVANIGMDTAVIAVLVTLAGVLDWSVRRFGRKSPG